MENNKKRVFAIRSFLKEYLDLHKDKDNELLTVETIRKGVSFKGANLWILIFATFMASLGLNVNSTAVIIGAMLISPLMGPIMGIGLAVGINDFELMKRSFKSYLIATLFSVITSTVFFLVVAPMGEAQSELLARTSPTIYDVLIALFGGLAGVVALSTKEKGNVIPGVAIATALMPPLCTAGYGLATGNLAFFLGAFYLYFINTVFIGVATFLGVRVMNFRMKEFVDKTKELRVRKYIIAVVIMTMIPALYLTVGIIRETVFQTAASRFINEELTFEKSLILDKSIMFHNKDGEKEIRIILVGDELPKATIDIVRAKMPKYNLENVKLNIVQKLSDETPDVTSIKALVLEDFYKESQSKLSHQQKELDSLKVVLNKYTIYDDLSGLSKEISVLYPKVKSISIAQSNEVHIGKHEGEAITWAILGYNGEMTSKEKKQIEEWLMARLNRENLKLIISH